MLLVKNGEPIARLLPLILFIEDGQVVAVNAAAGVANMASENNVENFMFVQFFLARLLSIEKDGWRFDWDIPRFVGNDE
jgi:hypothetical protein